MLINVLGQPLHLLDKSSIGSSSQVLGLLHFSTPLYILNNSLIFYFFTPYFDRIICYVTHSMIIVCLVALQEEQVYQVVKVPLIVYLQQIHLKLN